MRGNKTGLALLTLLPALGCYTLSMSSAGAAPDCLADAAQLAKQETELPRLEVAPPADRPITCITLETIMAFASRIKAHVAHCPASTYAPSATEWENTRLDYAKRFAQNKCKRTF